jgi:adenine deaminase
MISALSIREVVEAAQGLRDLTLLIKGAQVLNVFSGEIEELNIGVYRDRVVYLGKEERKARSSFRSDRRSNPRRPSRGLSPCQQTNTNE